MLSWIIVLITPLFIQQMYHLNELATQDPLGVEHYELHRILVDYPTDKVAWNQYTRESPFGMPVSSIHRIRQAPQFSVRGHVFNQEGEPSDDQNTTVSVALCFRGVATVNPSGVFHRTVRRDLGKSTDDNGAQNLRFSHDISFAEDELRGWHPSAMLSVTVEVLFDGDVTLPRPDKSWLGVWLMLDPVRDTSRFRWFRYAQVHPWLHWIMNVYA